MVGDRDQLYLLPVSIAEWLPEDHLAWFVLDAVAELDLEQFYAAYRRDGWGAVLSRLKCHHEQAGSCQQQPARIPPPNRHESDSGRS